MYCCLTTRQKYVRCLFPAKKVSLTCTVCVVLYRCDGDFSAESLHKSRLRFYKSKSSFHKSGISFHKSGTCFYNSGSCEIKSGSSLCKSRMCEGKPEFCEDKAENLWRQVSEMCGSLFCCSIIWLARIYLYVHYVRKKHSPVHRLFILHWFPSVLRVKACAVKHSRLRFLLWTLHAPTLHTWKNWKSTRNEHSVKAWTLFSVKKFRI